MTESYTDWKGWKPSDFGRFDLSHAVYFERELQASGFSVLRGLTVGELGYGNGTFAGWVRREGGHWVGREVDPELQQRASAGGFEVLAGGVGFAAEQGRGRFDAIVAFDVLEHMELPDIVAFLRDAREALKPGGAIIARCPSGDSPFSGAIYRGDLTHRTVLGSSAVRQLAAQVDLDVTQIRAPVLPVAGTGLLSGVRRAAVRAAQALTFRFIRVVLMGNHGAVIAPNMLVVLRKRGRPA